MEGNDGDAGGAVSSRALERYRRLGEGRWGVVVVEALSVDESSLARRNQMILSRANLDGFRRLADTYREANPDGVLLFQITHSGAKAGPFSSPTALYAREGGAQVLTEAQVEEIRLRFTEAAVLAADAGADGVDFKMCHGYFGAEMLRPANTRADRFGGSFENRSRFLLESIGELRSRLGDSFILGSRISCYEGIRGGCGTAAPDELIEDLSEMDTLVRAMGKAGMDYVNVSAGIPGVTSEITRPTPGSKLLYLHQFRYARRAKQIADESGDGLRVIGSAYSILKEEAPAAADENLSKGYADFAGFGRQSFADPLTPKKLMEGEPAYWCTACSGCSKLMVRQVNDGCVLYDPYYRGLLRRGAKEA
jgi:2,4-dienoyl-CoA reductase-like NADH-dependent reductase (Old Yellow Enzyme family)